MSKVSRVGFTNTFVGAKKEGGSDAFFNPSSAVRVPSLLRRVNGTREGRVCLCKYGGGVQ